MSVFILFWIVVVASFIQQIIFKEDDEKDWLDKLWVATVTSGLSFFLILIFKYLFKI